MKSFFPIVLLVCLFAISAVAQPNPDTLWTRTYGGSAGDDARSVHQTADGGYVVAGGSASFGAGSGDFYLVKTNGQGDTLWTRTYGGNSYDEAWSVQQTADGGYIVAGCTHSFGAGSGDFYLVKTNSQGDTLWTRTYGGSSDDGAWSCQQTADGGYIVAGYTASFGAGDFDFYLVKTNSQGDTLWTHTYGGNADDWAWSVQQTADGGYIVAGYTRSFGAGLDDFYLVKTNSQGDTLWTHTYGGSSFDGANSVQQAADGGYIVAGVTSSFGVGGDFYLVKTNSSGDTLWTHTYGGSNGDFAESVQQTADGGYIVAGDTWSFGAGVDDFYVVRTNSQGDRLWTRTYGGSSYDGAWSVQQTADGGYIVAGYTYSFGAGDDDFYLVKTGPDSPFHPPTAFSLLSPLLGDTCWTLDILFVWQTAFDLDPNDTVTYEVWLDTLANFSTPLEVASGLLDTAYSVQDIADDHAYYWTVHASDLNTTGRWASDTLMFYTYKPDAPESFALIEPQNDDTVFTATPTLRWRKAFDPDPGDAIRYQLMWSYAADFSVYEDTMLNDTSFAFPPNLLLNRGFTGGKGGAPLRVWRPTTARKTPHFPPAGGMRPSIWTGMGG